MTNVKEIRKFERIVNGAVHQLFISLPDRLEAHDLQDILGILEFQIFHVWMETQQKINLQDKLTDKNF